MGDSGKLEMTQVHHSVRAFLSVRLSPRPVPHLLLLPVEPKAISLSNVE